MKLIYTLLAIFSLLIVSFVWKHKAESSEMVYSAPLVTTPGFSKLQAHFHNYVDEGVLAGTSIFVSKSGQLFKDLYGMQNIEAALPMTEQTIFRLASMTKPITSVAVMMLVEEGQLQLDDPVYKYLPAFKNPEVLLSESERLPAKSVITIQQLLSHTGGITSAYDASPAGQLCRKVMADKNPTSLTELVDIVAKLPLSFQPGEGWAYSYSTDILALIVEKISGISIDQFFKERIFKPLQMENTGFQVPAEKVKHFAVLYASDEQGKLSVADDPQNSPFTNGENFPRGNGGLTSTITDYFRFSKMILNGGELEGVRLLKKETVQLMSQNVVPEKYLPLKVGGNELPGYGFGLGFGVLTSDALFGSEGDLFWPGSAFTYFFINPKEDLIGLFMTQFSDMSRMHLIGEFHHLGSEVYKEQ